MGVLSVWYLGIKILTVGETDKSKETQAERIGGYLKRIQQLQQSEDLLDERNKTCQVPDELVM